MHNSILKMAGSSQRLINLLPQTAHSATICGQTGCGKTVFILDLLEGPAGLNEKRKRHDKAVEQLQAAQAEWPRKRTERLDWISEDIHRQGHAVQTFRDVDDAMREY